MRFATDAAGNEMSTVVASKVGRNWRAGTVIKVRPVGRDVAVCPKISVADNVASIVVRVGNCAAAVVLVSRTVGEDVDLDRDLRPKENAAGIVELKHVRDQTGFFGRDEHHYECTLRTRRNGCARGNSRDGGIG